MTIGGSIVLLIAGAILRFAITAHVAHVNLRTVGLILMIGGAVGLVLGIAMRLFEDRQASNVGHPPPRPPAA
jgi:hypothetical protein